MTNQKPDYFLLGTAAALILLGIMVLAGASAPFSIENFGFPTALLRHQILYGLVPGIIVGLVAFRIPLNSVKKFAPALLLINILLLILVFVPKIGFSAGSGASRWISLGPITFQPSEFLKLTFLAYLAAWSAGRLGTNREKFRSLAQNIWQGGLAPFLLMTALIGALLILQPHMGALGIIALSGLVMYFAANTPVWHTVSLISIGAVLFISLIIVAPYRIERILVFLNPAIDPTGIGYQLKQALIAVGSGGVAGVGLGMGLQQLRLLPLAMSDAIFAVFANETGFLGAAALVLLFLVFLWRGVAIAKYTDDNFCKYLALGITSWITLQAFVNMGAMLGLVPLTGLPLPFISYGGSHLIAELTGVGVLLNISKNAA